jgi:DNA-binding phage protein
MHKKKTSQRREFSLQDLPITKMKMGDSYEWNLKKEFMDHKKIGAALLECLIDNDTETFIEILDSYLRVDQLQVTKKPNVARSKVPLTFFKNRNPTLKTLAKIVHETSAVKNSAS